VEHVSAKEFARLSKSNTEMSDHIVVLTAIVGAREHAIDSINVDQRCALAPVDKA
jgi:hypothetical protein